MSSKVLVLAAAVTLASCSPPEAAKPALWQVDGVHGERAWLFGTIHALPHQVAWQSARITAALAQSDRIVLEIATIDDAKQAEALFVRLGTGSALPPLAQRVDPAARAVLEKLLVDHRLPPGQFDGLETWAAALAINQLEMADDGASTDNGIEQQLLRSETGKPVDELEGLQGQLGIFDRLPEADQRVMLNESLAAGKPGKDESVALRRAWQTGDVKALAAMDHQGLLADPELRAAILTKRNQAWSRQLQERMAHGGRPFVAVGALHLVGPDGIAAQLAASGYRVTRLQ